MFAALRDLWNEYIDPKGGFSIVLIEGPLILPLAMAAFFYPLQVLIGVCIAAGAALVAYESYVFWRRHHPRHGA